MSITSILNNVIGPIMPGSSSSHTAGPYHIARTCRSIIGALPSEVSFIFSPSSSIAECYNVQGTDIALIMGMLELPLTHPEFRFAFDLAEKFGVKVHFLLENFPDASHPNSMKIIAKNAERIFEFIADSTGGGSFVVRKMNGCEICLTGDSHEMLTESDGKISQTRLQKPPSEIKEKEFYAAPVFHPICGERIFSSAEEMISYCEKNKISLSEGALRYEAALLSMTEEELNAEMDARLQVMLDSVQLGLSDESPEMFLLRPSAKKIWNSSRTALGGANTRAAIKAMAAMQVNSGQGIVCAAPTGGSAGVIPGVVSTLIDDMGKTRADALRALWAAGAIGLILATRATFAAEVAGCQVEIGAAGAMGAAAVVDAAGGGAREACDAGAIVFQNAMGLICDLVQGIVELPCHTRNASFASQAFVCADLVMGGYHNPINLDETIDAVYSVGLMMPAELRCTSLGGLAICPSAMAIKKRR